MSASTHEIQPLADQILERIGATLRTGQLVIHFSEGVVQRAEANSIFKIRASQPLRRNGVDIQQT